MLQFTTFTNSHLKSIFLVLVFFSILVGYILQTQEFVNDADSRTKLSHLQCITESKKVLVVGNSLEPLITDGKYVEAVFGYYDCNNISRGDVVLYSHTSNSRPFIKIIKGIPEDRFDFLIMEQGQRALRINEEVQKNSIGEIYKLDNQSLSLLKLYYQDYGGVIPENTYLLLGDLIGGSIDSTKFGLVDRSSIIAKVKVLKPI
jgi:signal peptidase I